MEDIREILRVFKQTGNNYKATTRLLKCSRGTVKKYVRWARKRGFLKQDRLPSEQELHKALSEGAPGRGFVQETLETYRDIISAWIKSEIPLTRIHEMLVERYGWTGGYTTLKRFTLPMRKDRGAFVRIEVAPGEEAQVDFGYMGLMYDPVAKRRRRLWVFLMTLSHSRHMYGEFVFSQDISTWVGCHRRAFEHFGGVPKRLVIDNLKAAVIKAALHDPLITRTYRECAEHYGFVISPCKPGTPAHKGKVERGVAYVKKSFWPGRDFNNTADANTELIDWIMLKAGLRIHGTTKQPPLLVFEQVEHSMLQPLPETQYVMSTWKKAKLHDDCHIVADKSYYSAPHRLRGQQLIARITDTMVHIFHEYELIASHVRAHRPGTRRTNPDHYPPEKAAFLEKTPQWCLRKAREIGSATFKLILAILSGRHPCDGLRRAQGIIGLGKRYGYERLENASKRSLYFEVYTYQSIKRILEKEMDRLPLELPEESDTTPAKKAYTFARPIEDFIHHTKH